MKKIEASKSKEEKGCKIGNQQIIIYNLIHYHQNLNSNK